MSTTVPNGYKQTKIGVIPEDWEVVRLGDVTEYVDYRGKTPKKVEHGILLVTARNIKQGYLDYEISREYIAKDDYSNVMSRGVPKMGDVLLTTEAPLGNTAQIDNENIALAQRVIKFRANGDLDNTYLKYHFLSEKFQGYLLRLAIGTTVLGIQGKQLHKMNIPLPPLKEQQKIAQILTTWDKAIAQQEALITAKEELKKGLMQKLLSGEVRFGGFDEEWEEVQLGDIAEVIMGQSPSSKTYNEDGIGIPLIQGNADCKNRKTFPRIYTTEKTKECNIGDIIMTVRAPVGAISESCHNACIGRGVCAIKSKEDDQFLFHFLVTYEKKWEKYSQGSTFTAVNGNDIKKLKIKLPPLQEQQKIAQVLTTADKEIKLLKEELEALKEQKRGLIQKLLPGEVRVAV